jgi:DNA-binding NarL/FixJ family response regulator
VVVVDGHPVSRAGLTSLLRGAGHTVVGEAESIVPATVIARRERPDVIVVDPSLNGSPGVETIRRLASSAPGARMVVLMDEDELDVLGAFAAGASACILTDTPVPGILKAISAAASGRSVVSPRLATELVRRMELHATVSHPPVELSAREREVLALVARGWENERIASTLYVSRATVKHHISSILEKLGVENRIQAAVHAVRLGLLDR